MKEKRQPKCCEEAQRSVSMQSRMPKVVKVSSNPTKLFLGVHSLRCLLSQGFCFYQGPTRTGEPYAPDIN